MLQTAKKISVEIKRTIELNYLEDLPKGYDAKNGKKYPLLVFLHGMGERGNKVSKIKVHGIPKIIENKSAVLQKYEFIAISPQCPDGYNWSSIPEAVENLIRDCIDTLSVDTSRIYLTGLSMGGFGTWTLACRNPYAFAAAAPICGGLRGEESEDLSAIAHLPMWVFHGAKDAAVPLSASADPVAKLYELGSDVRFTVYPEVEHDSWTETYENPHFYKWLFSQKNEAFKF
jgi:predicted peptidase